MERWDSETFAFMEESHVPENQMVIKLFISDDTNVYQRHHFAVNHIMSTPFIMCRKKEMRVQNGEKIGFNNSVNGVTYVFTQCIKAVIKITFIFYTREHFLIVVQKLLNWFHTNSILFICCFDSQGNLVKIA